jgi:integrase
MATLSFRPTTQGDTRWRVQVRRFGVRRSATFLTRQAAKDWAAQQESALRTQHYFGAPAAARHTLEELLTRYEREVLPHKAPARQRDQAQQLAWWAAQLGTLTLDRLTPARLAACRDRLAIGRAPATVNRYLAALSHALTVASREWGWLESHPLRQVTKLPEPRGRVRVLSDAERAQLLAACQASATRWLYPVVVLALATGARKMELLRLSWRDVDLQHGRLLLEHTKNRARRTVPLTGHARAVVQDLAKVRRLDTALVFPRADGRAPVNLRAAWRQAVAAAGLTDLRFHDLRHCCASSLAMHGASLLDIAAVLGHKTLTMVQRYAHLTETHTAAVVARMTAAILP